MASVFSMHGSGMNDLDSKYESKYQFKKGDKAPKDENAPKKPLSAYFRFMGDVRKEVEKKHPGKASDHSKIFAQMWKDLPKDQKAKYEKETKKRKEVHMKLMNAYRLSGDHMAFQEKLHAFKIFETTLPFKKDPNMPKKSLSSYMLFGNHIRPKVVEENEGIKVTEVMSKISEKWNKLSDKEKAKWTKKAESEKMKHAKEVEKYMKSKKRAEYEKEKQEYLAEMKQKRTALKKKGVKRALNEPDEQSSAPPAKKPKASHSKKESKKESKKNSKPKIDTKKKDSKKGAKKSKKAKKPSIK